MKLDVISIGDELLIGQTLNTNAFWISKELNNVGFVIRQQLTIGDTKEVIIDTLNESLKEVDVVLITGGLGPTKDDLTMPTLNEYFGGKLVQNDEVYADIERLIHARGTEMNKNNKKQALVPDICKPVRNYHGTAPGLWFDIDDKVVVSMPGVPYEMKAMVTDTVIPWLKEKYRLPEIIHHMVYTQGIPESILAEKIESWEDHLPEVIKLAYLPSPGRVKLRLSSIGNDRNEMQQLINEEIKKLSQIIPQYIYSDSGDELQQVIGKLLKEKNATIATAESCTGGFISHLITEVAGSSDYYKGSVISYANEVKMDELKVKQSDIVEYGAVSQQVVEQMALGVQAKLNTDYAISTSGIAGPTGGSDEKPVGTVWIAVATPHKVISKKYIFGKQRKVNIERAAVAALGMLRKVLN